MNLEPPREANQKEVHAIRNHVAVEGKSKETIAIRKQGRKGGTISRMPLIKESENQLCLEHDRRHLQDKHAEKKKHKIETFPISPTQFSLP
ncbi:hypothetical protein V6N12_051615 [Hibiscus sabdariffa]|uniref:Uncharacterized protein n=1 Tax=Hibiscus sabdariffa TaxID=183260 RepID=A0ABR2GGD8_9ROSI